MTSPRKPKPRRATKPTKWSEVRRMRWVPIRTLQDEIKRGREGIAAWSRPDCKNNRIVNVAFAGIESGGRSI